MSALCQKQTLLGLRRDVVLSLSSKQILKCSNLWCVALATLGRFGSLGDCAQMIKVIKAAIEKITPAGEDPFWCWITVVGFGLFVANVFWIR